jgi:PAS domain S-box-containing protein
MAGGLYVVTLDRVIAYWNAGAERITGYAEHEVKGLPCGASNLDHRDE